MQPTRTGPAGPARHRYSPPCCLPLASGSSCVLARAWPRRPPPPCLAASSFPGPSRDAMQPRPPLTSPSLSGPPSPSLLCFPSRDRTEPPPPTRATVATGHPRLTDAPGSSAGPPSTSSTSHEAPDVPQHRPRCLLQPRDRRPSSSNSPAPDRPRPRRASPRHRRESLTLSPNSACSPPCRSAVPHEHRSHRPPLLLHA